MTKDCDGDNSNELLYDQLTDKNAGDGGNSIGWWLILRKISYATCDFSIFSVFSFVMKPSDLSLYIVNGCGGAFLHPTHVLSDFSKFYWWHYILSLSLLLVPSAFDFLKLCLEYSQDNPYLRSLLAFLITQYVIDTDGQMMILELFYTQGIIHCINVQISRRRALSWPHWPSSPYRTMDIWFVSCLH